MFNGADDLMEEAYKRADRRRQCSREDFFDGYRAALLDVGSWLNNFTVPMVKAIEGSIIDAANEGRL